MTPDPVRTPVPLSEDLNVATLESFLLHGGLMEGSPLKGAIRAAIHRPFAGLSDVQVSKSPTRNSICTELVPFVEWQYSRGRD